jgi:hypothetical protein
MIDRVPLQCQYAARLPLLTARWRNRGGAGVTAGRLSELDPCTRLCQYGRQRVFSEGGATRGYESWISMLPRAGGQLLPFVYP